MLSMMLFTEQNTVTSQFLQLQQPGDPSPPCTSKVKGKGGGWEWKDAQWLRVHDA